MTAVDSLHELLERATVEIVAAEREALERWRQWAGETEIRRHRAAYPVAIDAYEKALVAKRVADQSVKEAREAHGDAVVDGEYEYEGRFEKKGASWQLIVGADGNALPEPRPMTADDRRAWLARAAATLPAVKEAAKRLAEAEWAQSQAADDVAVADRKVTAAKYLLQSATVELDALSRAIPVRDR